MPGCSEPPLQRKRRPLVNRHHRRSPFLAAAAVTLALLGVAGLSLTALEWPALAQGKKPLRIAYSDWPGWVAFEVGIQKGWFKAEGVDVEFSWFDYLPSMDAFSAGKVDAV